MDLLGSFVRGQARLCRKFDLVLPEKYRIDGNQDFRSNFVTKYLRPSLRVYDLGGGKDPFFSVHQKRDLGLNVIGIDIDRAELDQAPLGTYDQTITADVATYQGDESGDVVICQALLEHVRDVRPAFAAMASLLKPGGTALIFVPSRNAVFARINVLLPESIKRWILFSLFPHARRGQGFPSYYDRCTPKAFRTLAAQHDLVVIEETHYYVSAYFTFFFPLYFLWRIWILTYHALVDTQAAETFCMALRKESSSATSSVSTSLD